MVTVKDFGTTPEGKVIKAFTLTNEKGVEATIIERGATLVSLIAPDKDGNRADIILGYDNLEQYLVNECFFGSTVGRSANRIANAKMSIDGVSYDLEVNDGPNNLHTHTVNGFHKRNWEGSANESENAVSFFVKEEDGQTLFPGALEMTVTYKLSEDGELSISYHGKAEKKTLINCTNHTYFNLAGHNSGNIHGQYLTLNASRYIPVVAGAIPTGEWAPVEGTPFDFRKERMIGQSIDDDEEQLKLVAGYDHNWCIDDADHTQRLAAVAFDPASGRTLSVYTDLPGIQFYAGNMISDQTGKEGAKYTKRSGFCLETQYFPDCINQESFEKPLFGPDKEYITTTVYKIGIK